MCFALLLTTAALLVATVASPAPLTAAEHRTAPRGPATDARVAGTFPADVEQVDLELVLAVDISLSMDIDELKLQRDGYIAAFRDPELLRAIQSGPNGRIAVTYFEWAGADIQSQLVPWTIIDGREAAERFVSQLETAPVNRARRTSISSALDYGARLFQSTGVQGLRRVIDISGDGPNNAGRPVLDARDDVLGQGIVINGLPILLRDNAGGFFDMAGLDAYYRDCVIGGVGSFLVTIRERSEFISATRQKLLLEIAGLTPPMPWAQGAFGTRDAKLAPRPVQAKPGESKPGEPKSGEAPGSGATADCMTGERMWRRYWQDPFRE